MRAQTLYEIEGPAQGLESGREARHFAPARQPEVSGVAGQADGALPVPTEVEDLVREGVLHPFDVDLEDARADTVESR